MKKTLLIAAATLAAGVIAAQADSPVYSQNIVGYVNVNCASGGATPLSTPLDIVDSMGITNVATNVLSNPFNVGIGNGPLDNSMLLVWTGTKYQNYLFDANPDDAAALGQTFTGITDSYGNFVTPPVLGNGKGYFLIYNQITGFAPSNTVTYVGTVRGSVTGGLSNAVTITSSPMTSLTASGLPLGGGLLTGLGLTNLLAQGSLDSCTAQIPKINAKGLVAGYTVYLFDSNPQDAVDLGQTYTGITDLYGNFVPEPIITTGEAFLIINQGGTPLTWAQQVTF
jgi:hypothetical protein